MSITDFEEWLANNEPANNEEAFQLHQAIEDEEPVGVYTVERKGQQVFCRGGSDDWLLLASPQAVAAFKKRIEGYCPDPDMGWEGSEAFRRAMAKDD